MFELRVIIEFSAAHHLTDYPGDCARPHGHNWKLEVFARSKSLDSIGLAIDFKDLKRAAKDLVEIWDHQDLNQLEDFKVINPSAEQIAKLSYDRLSRKINNPRTWIERVTLWEYDRSWASYWDE